MKKLFSFFILLAACFIPATGPANALEWSYIDNGRIRLGVIKDWGASVAYFSLVSPERNLLNYFDKGREIQQSYYGNVYGGYCPGFNPGMESMWNSVQAGDALGNSARVLEFSNDGNSIYAKTVPKDWCLNNVDVDGFMEEWITLTKDTAKIHFKFTYTGGKMQASHEQEAPAMFFDISLKNSVSYEGVFPWSNGALMSFVPADCFGAGARVINNPENWASYVDDNNWGIGIYKPGASRFVACLDPGDPGSQGFGASYLSTGDSHAFSAGSVYEYDVYLTIGAIDEIRSRFHDVYSGSYAGIPEGGLIRARGDKDVWVVKYAGAKKFKRLILNPRIFNSYRHFKWGDIKEVDKSVVDSFATSDFVRADGDLKVYKIYPDGDIGQKRWIATTGAFNRLGFDWDAVYLINQAERDTYSAGQTIE